MIRVPVIATVALILTAATMPNVTLTGSVKDCIGRTRYEIPGVTIAAFNPTKNRKMVDLLHSMDTAVFANSDTAALTRFSAKYDQLISLVATSTALARTASDTTGSFVMSIAAMDSAVVIGYKDIEGDLNYYSYRMVGARSNSSFYLDMSGGECYFP